MAADTATETRAGQIDLVGSPSDIEGKERLVFEALADSTRGSLSERALNENQVVSADAGADLQQAKQSDSKSTAADVPSPTVTERSNELPALSLESSSLELRDSRAALPWTDKHPDGRLKQHMSYGQIKDAIVKLGEGPHHVAKRLLGPGARDEDVKVLTDAMIEQYKAESSDSGVLTLRNGHRLITEKNVVQILSRIGDEATRFRIIDKLKTGWSEKEPPVAVPFEAHGRQGETHPNKIDDPAQFLKDIAAAAVDVKADQYRARGLCAAGFRLAINELPNWRIDGGTVDRSINKDINGWRSGLQMALDLAQTGLFDVIPLKELGYKNLKEGYIVGRYHYPDYVKARPRWEGEDMGDIDVYTKRHKPPNDDDEMYHDSFVLLPKGLKR